MILVILYFILLVLTFITAITGGTDKWHSDIPYTIVLVFEIFLIGISGACIMIYTLMTGGLR